MAPLSRRSFLVASGAVGAGIVLAACGGDDSGGSTLPSVETTAANGAPSIVMVRFAVDGIVATGTQRIPVGLADAEGVLLVDTPDQLTVQLATTDGKAMGSPFAVDRHAQGLPRPYYPVVTDIAEAGTYAIVATVDGVQTHTSFSVVEPSAVPIPSPGDQMVPVDTPTTTDAHGVTPICTRDPECDLHATTLTDALKAGQPVAFLIATPAYCQTAACGPVLDVLLSQQAEFGDRMQMVHAEVYTDDTLATTTAAVQDYRLSFEPVLYLAGADGVIKARLDSIYDEVEVRAALEALVS